MVVPSFNGHRTLPYLLRSLRRQVYSNFEVILVDDGSSPPVTLPLLEEADGLRLKLVRARHNLGYTPARNVGIQCAEGEVLVLMDDDLQAPPSLTLAAALRHERVDRMLFLGFRASVDWPTYHSTPGCLPALERDWRWQAQMKPTHVRLSVFDAAERTGTIRIMEETALLKRLGHGAALGYWDLPPLMSSHDISLRRSDVIDAGGFAEDPTMNRWGMDDLSFGAIMIAAGFKVAPALEWRCWHLLQEGRETTRARQFATFVANWEDYLRYIDRRWPAQGFPFRRISRVARHGSVEELRVA